MAICVTNTIADYWKVICLLNYIITILLALLNKNSYRSSKTIRQLTNELADRSAMCPRILDLGSDKLISNIGCFKGKFD